MKVLRPQIFLSSVSQEFRDQRESLSRDLRGPDSLYEVTEQSDFTVGGASLLEKLDSYISRCSGIVHLVGAEGGAVANPEAVRVICERYPDLLSSHPDLRAGLGDFSDLSYTQWEAYLALHHGVPCFVFVSEPFADAFREGTLATAPGGAETPQRAHFARLKKMGKHYDTFTTADRLSVQVLRTLAQIVTSAPAGGGPEFEPPPWHEGFDAEPASQPLFELLLGLPHHLLAGIAMRTEIELRSTSTVALEDISIEIRLGPSTLAHRFSHLPKGAARTAAGEIRLLAEDAGARVLQVEVGATRGALRETFHAEAAVEVHLDTFPPLQHDGSGRIPAHLHAATAPAQFSMENRRHGIVPKPVPLQLAGEVLQKRIGAGELLLVPIPAAGSRFVMGTPAGDGGGGADETSHPVLFAHSWWMGRFPISQSQFEGLMGYNPALFAEPSGNLPVEKVSWDEAAAFCHKLTETERAAGTLPGGFGYRLPTEAEWEFACRAGTAAAPYGTATGTKGAGQSPASRRPTQTLPLDGGRGANRWGLCDMLGNVYEWTLDSYAPYPDEVREDPRSEGGKDSQRVIRGGCWQDPPERCCATARVSCPPDRESGRIGFRVVLARG